MADIQRRQVDSAWLEKKFKDAGRSGREIARDIGMNYSAFNRRVHGIYAWRPDELAQLAPIVHATMQELLKRTGTEMVHETQAMVQVVGMVAPSGLVQPRVPSGYRRAERPAVSATDVQAVRLASPGHWHDGFVFYYVPTAGVDPEAMRALSVVEDRGGERYLGFLDRGKGVGTHCIVPFPGSGECGADLTLAWAAPVVWVKTR